MTNEDRELLTVAPFVLWFAWATRRHWRKP